MLVLCFRITLAFGAMKRMNELRDPSTRDISVYQQVASLDMGDGSLAGKGVGVYLDRRYW